MLPVKLIQKKLGFFKRLKFKYHSTGTICVIGESGETNLLGR